jgi:cell wall-associated NlpC family hydrolase
VLTLSKGRVRVSALLMLLVSAFGVVGTASPANAAYSWRSQVPAEAAKHNGAPYQWGAAGPSRFDCSGLTLFVYRHFGKSLPHSSAQQYGVMHHFAPSQKVPGDLLFFKNSSGRISHVAIYAGSGYMWHAPHSGSTVRKIKIYSSNYLVGRL